MDIKHICFDINKTLIEENSWLNLNIAMGVTKEEDEYLFSLYKKEIITYKEWQDILTKIYIKSKLASFGFMRDVIYNYTYKPEVKETISYLIKKGYSISLLSGGVDILVDKVGLDLGIKMCGSNNIFVFDENEYLKDIIVLGDDKEVKLTLLSSYANRLGVDIEECACVGDGDNDELIFIKTKHGITFRGSKIEKSAWKIIDTIKDIQDIF
jgi:phosphoserine phosphatase